MADLLSFRLRLIDGFGLFMDGHQVHVSRRKSQALLTYLWLKQGHTETRLRLSNLLWSRSGDSEARVSLRQELSRLNKELTAKGDILLAGDKFAIWLTKSVPPSDAEAILAEIPSGVVPTMLLDTRRIHEQYLSHFEGIDPELDLWISVQRSGFFRGCQRALSTLATTARHDGLARDVARALLNLDPSDESACRQLMEFAVQHGNIPEALRLYEELKHLLASDYDTHPSEALKNYVSDLTRLRSVPGPKTGVPAAPPLRERSDGRLLLLIHPVRTVYPANGAEQRFSVLRNELIGALSRFRDWSVRAFDEADHDLAILQHVDKVYEVVISGESVGETDFLTVNLLSMASKACLWSEQLKVDYMRFTGQQRDTIRQIAFALNIEISAHRLGWILDTSESSLDVYDRWLLGQSLLLSWRPKEEARAETIFRSILATNGTFAPAIASLVQILNTRHHVFPGVTRNSDRALEALTLARRASQMAPHDCRTQLTLAWSYLMNGEYDQAIYYFRMAVDINDNDPWTLISSAQGLCYAGEKASSVELAERATLVGRGGDAMHWAYLACIQFHAENYPAALQAIDRAGDNAYFILGMRAAILAQIGNNVAAASAASTFESQIKSAWYGREKPTQRNIRNWFTQIFPIRMLADRERLERALDNAGFGIG